MVFPYSLIDSGGGDYSEVPAATSQQTATNRYYNYYTGEWVSDPSLIAPRATPSSTSSTFSTSNNNSNNSDNNDSNPDNNADNTNNKNNKSDLELWLKDGYTAGNFPAEFEPFFGKPTNVQGWKLIQNANGTYQMSVLVGQNDSDGGLMAQTFGAVLSKDKGGNWVANARNVSSGGSGSTSGTGGSTTGLPGTSTPTSGPGSPGYNDRKSAYDLLYQQFAKYGLGGLVTPLEDLIKEGIPASEFSIRLRETEPYKRRFAANQARISKGLGALTEAEYIGLEDAYQGIMRQYGMPESYYSRGEMGRQEGFEKFIAGDVSPAELETRISNVYNRVINANPEVSIALKTFYPNITNGDILAYALDPNRALDEINRKITAAEIGASAVQSGLTTNESDAEYLARYGITKQQAQQGYRTISGFLPRAQQLSDIYGKQVEGGPYTQASAEREVFNVPGAAEEERKRRKITALEEAAFSGSSGLTGGALGRERAGSF